MISVVIPTYNGAETLKRSLPTWASQTISKDKFEVYVVDNRSNDNTREVVEMMTGCYPNFHYLYEGAPGATAARHAGARMAEGSVLVFADDDGLFNPECLEKIIAVYDQNPQCEAVTGKIEILWDSQEPDWIAPYKYMLGQLDYGEDVRYGYNMYLNGGLMSVRKSTFERLHGFNPDLVGNYLIGDGDTGFVKKMFKDHCLIGYTPYAVMQHIQKVSVHGSVEGMAQHFFNNGTADSYAVYRENGFVLSLEVRRFKFGQRLALVKKWLQYYVLRNKSKRIYFSLQQRKGALRFFRYLRQPELAKLIKIDNVY